MSSASKHVHHSLDIPAEQALFEGEVAGLVVTFHENERPLQGLAGLMDWRFQGALSRNLRSGAITGAPGECAYFPFTRHGITYHLILAGAGSAHRPGERHLPPAETIQALKKNLASLKIPKVGISRRDFGNASEEFIARQFKEVDLWILA
ncbi:MAG: hypothetical protein NDJ89_05725 [Oligoflexia bacterium]|nr:hypothetical protein [Oligoflexia bacterium]